MAELKTAAKSLFLIAVFLTASCAKISDKEPYAGYKASADAFFYGSREQRTEAAAEMKKNAENNPAAAFYALMHEKNIPHTFITDMMVGKAPDYGIGAEDIENLRKLSDRSIAYAMLPYALGLAAKDGKKSARKVKKLIIKAAENGNITACDIAGDIYYFGSMYLDIDPDYAKAKKYYLLAEAEGSHHSVAMLGEMHRFGRGFIEDKKETKKLFEKAIRMGDERAKRETVYID